MLSNYYDIQYVEPFYDEATFSSSINSKINFPTSLVRINNVLLLVKSTITSSFEWDNLLTTYSWHPENLNRLGEDGRFIISLLANHDKVWRVHMASNTRITGQEIAVMDNLKDLKKYIKKQWSRGMDVTDLYNHKGSFYIVTSSGLNWQQAFYTGDFSEKTIRKFSSEGKVITEVMDIGEDYLWIFSGNTGYQKQIFRFTVDLKDLIPLNKKLLSDDGFEGYRLSLIRNFKNQLFYVFLK